MIYLAVSLRDFIIEHWLFSLIIAAIIICGILVGIGLNKVHGLFPFRKHTEHTIHVIIEIKESKDR